MGKFMFQSAVLWDMGWTIVGCMSLICRKGATFSLHLEFVSYLPMFQCRNIYGLKIEVLRNEVSIHSYTCSVNKERYKIDRTKMKMKARKDQIVTKVFIPSDTHVVCHWQWRYQQTWYIWVLYVKYLHKKAKSELPI